MRASLCHIACITQALDLFFVAFEPCISLEEEVKVHLLHFWCFACLEEIKAVELVLLGDIWVRYGLEPDSRNLLAHLRCTCLGSTNCVLTRHEAS